MLASGNPPDNQSHVSTPGFSRAASGFTLFRKQSANQRVMLVDFSVRLEVNQQQIIWKALDADFYQSFIIVSHSISDKNSFDYYISIGLGCHYDILCDTNRPSWTETLRRALIGQSFGSRLSTEPPENNRMWLRGFHTANIMQKCITDTHLSHSCSSPIPVLSGCVGNSSSCSSIDFMVWLFSVLSDCSGSWIPDHYFGDRTSLNSYTKQPLCEPLP